MAAGMVVDSGNKGGYAGRLTSYVILSCITAAMGGLIFGYDIGVSGGVTSMEPFLRKFFPKVYVRMSEDSRVSNYCKFDSQLLTLFTSSLYIAGLFACFFASLMTRSLGRRPSMLFGGAAFLTGASIGGAAINIYMLILGRVLLGVGVGFANQSVPLYLSEMAPSKYRGAFNHSFQLCVGIGVLSANLINYGTQKIKQGWGWRLSIAGAGVPASFLTLGALFLPETPNSLIQRGLDIRKARSSLQKIRGTVNIDEELHDLVEASETSKATKNPFREMIRPNYRPHLVMSIALQFFQQVTGINVISFYAPVLFRAIGLEESASLLSAVVTGTVGTVATFISMLVVDRFGRRFLFFIGGAQMFVSQVIIGFILLTQLKDQGSMGKGYAYLVLALICTYVAGFAWSWGPLGWLVPSEIYPLEIRSAGQSITVAMNFLFTFVIAQTFLAMLCRLKSGLFFFFAGWVALMTLFIYLFLPETKNVPIEQMNRIWMNHWFWRKYVRGDDKMSARTMS